MIDPGSADLELARAYFNLFKRAFAAFDGARIADLYVTPSVILGGNGSLVSFDTRADVVRYYQSALDRYRKDGAQSCQWSDLSVNAMGVRSFMATVTWELFRSDGTLLARWRQSYCLGRFGNDGPKAFAVAA